MKSNRRRVARKSYTKPAIDAQESKLSLRRSAYLCVLCVKGPFQRRGRRDTQRTAEKTRVLFVPLSRRRTDAAWFEAVR